jgi:hypothetical protein
MIKSHTCGIVDMSIYRWNDTCVWFYHSTYKWTYPQYHVCVILSFHLQMDLSTFVWFIPPTNGHIHNTTVDMSICRWNDNITHMWISPCVGGMIKSHTCGIVDKSIWKWNDKITRVILSFHLQMDISTIPHVYDFIIPPTNGHIHNTTCVWFYHSTYKWTYPQYHVFEFIIPPTNGLIHMVHL